MTRIGDEEDIWTWKRQGSRRLKSTTQWWAL